VSITQDAWLTVMGREYLASFVPEGGGAVRFVVGDANMLTRGQ
jgi:hypothetical protein